jgi:hypothetical protein
LGRGRRNQSYVPVLSKQINNESGGDFERIEQLIVLTQSELMRSENDKANLQAVLKTLEYQVKQAISLIKVEHH